MAWSRATIGGPLPSQRNVVSANGEGISVSSGTGSTTTYDGPISGTTIEGNYIGTDASGTLDRGNNLGVSIFQYFPGTISIGGGATGASNRIAYNKTAGVKVFSAVNDEADPSTTTIRQNEIFSNGGAGIDTGGAGVNFDDNPDTGELNRPVITEVIDEGTNWRVKGTLPPRPSQTFTLDFYANADHDTTGYGEGAKWIGSQNASTDASGAGAFDFSVAKVAGMPVISVTATDSRGETSEFSNTRLPPTPFGIITGLAFQDLDADGVRDSGEGGSPLAQIYVDLNNDGQWQVGEPTSSYSSFRLVDVPVGTHTLRVSLLNDRYFVTTPNGADGIPVTVSAYAQTSKDIGIGRREVYVRGYLRWDYLSDGLNIGDPSISTPSTVWADLNNDGALDPNEPQTTTASNGSYLLALLPGTYTIRALTPTGFREIGQSTRTVNLPNPGDSALNVDFGFDNFASEVWVNTFYDANDNGIMDGSEKVERNQTLVYLDVNNNGTFDSGIDQFGTTRTANSSLIFSLTAGEYRFNAPLPNNIDDYRITTSVPATITLGQYEDKTLYVGYRLLGKINVWVYEDANTNWTQDSGEPQFDGRTVYIDLNQNGQLDNNEPSQLSKSTGPVTFNRLEYGDYTVRTIVPGGSIAVRGVESFYLPAGWSWNVALSTRVGTPPPTASISGVTYNDNNANTLFDTGDTLISGKTVFLDANNNGRLDSGEKSTKSDTSGKYTFGSLPAGTYYVRRVFPTGYTYSNLPLNLALTSGQVYSHANIGSVPTGTVVTPPGDNPPPPPPVDQFNASIAGVTYNDNNANGIFDTGDTLISGKTVFLDANNNGKLDTGEKSTKSNSSGAFTFTALAAGTYNVRRVFPTGYTYSNQPLNLSLTAGQAFAGANIGSVPTGTVITPPGDNPPPPPPPPPPPAQFGSISGVLFNDNNANGVFDTGDSPISRVVFLDANGNGKLDSGEKSTTSASNGTFTFANLSAGTYLVRRAFPTGYKASNPPRDYVLAGGQVITGADIGSVPSGTTVIPPGDTPPPPPPPPGDTGSISGFLFWDSDRDGTFDPGESYQSAKTVFIDLDDDNILDSNERRLTTDSQGRFTFDDVAPGTYVIKRVVPKGYAITTPKQTITLTAGQIFSGVAIGTNTN
jgi:hypothetical protein